MRKVTRFPSALSLAVLLAAAAPAWSQASASGSGNTPLYETFELTFDASGVGGNKFRSFASVTFSKGGRTFQVDGFHDGGTTWRARFMPDETGTWSYSWSFNGSSGSGTFSCTSRSNAANHGHAKRDPARPRYLVYDDGTAHHWFGSMWFGMSNIVPNYTFPDGSPSGTGKGNDAQKLAYLDVLRQNRHNGTYATISWWPLRDDKFTWEVGWIRRLDWFLDECRTRGIYVQVGFFNTWARARGSYTTTTSGPAQVMNVWSSGDETAKENYIRYIVARFAGFSNVYWELGNEMEHSPNSGSAFVTQANAKYIPWIRQYDPYDLPIGLSEGVWTGANVDVGFLHQSDRLPATSTNGNRPNLMNELVRGCSHGSLWQDSVIRNGGARLCYRRTFWRMFTYGGAGSSEATHLQLDTPLNSAVLNVMGDQKRLRDFLDTVPSHWNDMVTDTGFVISGPGSSRTRRRSGEAYVVYFLGSSGSGTVRLDLPAGTYETRWYHPSSGQWESPVSVTSSGGSTSVSHPSFGEDLALRVLSSSGPSNQPPTAQITTPSSNGQSFPAGSTLTFAGNASDPEDGTLTGGSLTWWIDRIGDGFGAAQLGPTGTSGTQDLTGTLTNPSGDLVQLDAAGADYDLILRAADSQGATTEVKRRYSVTAPPVSPPSDPQNLTASAVSASRIDLSWTDTSSTEDGFRIERRTGTSGTFSEIATAPSGTTAYSDTGLSSSTLYVYRVRAYNAGGNSGYTNEAGATTSSATGGLISSTAPAGYAWRTLTAGTEMYIDRTYTFQSAVPSILDGELVLQTANDDKASSTAIPDFVSFVVNQDVAVYVLYTDVNTTLEADWLNPGNGWAAESFTVPTSLPGAEADRLVRSKFYASGSTVSLPGNGATSGTSSMYNVVVVPSSGGGPSDSDGDGLSDLDETTLHGTNPQVADTDGDGMGDGGEVAYGLDPLESDQDQNGTLDGQDDWNGNLATNQADLSAGISPGLPPLPGGGSSGTGSKGGSTGCGATGMEMLLIVSLLAGARRSRRRPRQAP